MHRAARGERPIGLAPHFRRRQARRARDEILQLRRQRRALAAARESLLREQLRRVAIEHHLVQRRRIGPAFGGLQFAAELRIARIDRRALALRGERRGLAFDTLLFGDDARPRLLGGAESRIERERGIEALLRPFTVSGRLGLQAFGVQCQHPLQPFDRREAGVDLGCLRE